MQGFAAFVDNIAPLLREGLYVGDGIKDTRLQDRVPLVLESSLGDYPPAGGSVSYHYP